MSDRNQEEQDLTLSVSEDRSSDADVSASSVTHFSHKFRLILCPVIHGLHRSTDIKYFVVITLGYICFVNKLVGFCNKDNQ